MFTVFTAVALSKAVKMTFLLLVNVQLGSFRFPFLMVVWLHTANTADSRVFKVEKTIIHNVEFHNAAKKKKEVCFQEDAYNILQSIGPCGNFRLLLQLSLLQFGQTAFHSAK